MPKTTKRKLTEQDIIEAEMRLEILELAFHTVGLSHPSAIVEAARIYGHFVFTGKSAFQPDLKK